MQTRLWCILLSICCVIASCVQGNAQDHGQAFSPYPHSNAKYHWSYKCTVSRTPGLTHGCRVVINGNVFGDVQKVSFVTVETDKKQEYYYFIQSFEQLGGGSVNTEGLSQGSLSFSVTGTYTVISEAAGDITPPNAVK